jgi:hypothetical protein
MNLIDSIPVHPRRRSSMEGSRNLPASSSMTESLSGEEGGDRVRYIIRAARVITGATFEGVEFEVQDASPEQAKRLLEHFWASAKAAGTAVVAGPTRPLTRNPFQDELDSLRREIARRGWGVSDLARHAKLAINTARSAISGKSVHAATRKKIRDALGME